MPPNEVKNSALLEVSAEGVIRAVKARPGHFEQQIEDMLNRQHLRMKRIAQLIPTITSSGGET